MKRIFLMVGALVFLLAAVYGGYKYGIHTWLAQEVMTPAAASGSWHDDIISYTNTERWYTINYPAIYDVNDTEKDYVEFTNEVCVDRICNNVKEILPARISIEAAPLEKVIDNDRENVRSIEGWYKKIRKDPLSVQSCKIFYRNYDDIHNGGLQFVRCWYEWTPRQEPWSYTYFTIANDVFYEIRIQLMSYAINWYDSENNMIEIANDMAGYHPIGDYMIQTFTPFKVEIPSQEEDSR